MTVIKVENLGKKYLIGHDKKAKGTFRYNSMRDSITHSIKGIYQRIRHPLSPNMENLELEEFWALKDINFEIKQGDRIGIIGHNGAGKTTLLKLLSRITHPTTGSIKIKGRIASLLEVGTGFHPELSGRENIYLNGAILGMKRVEIKKKFDEIVDFAEIEKFLDTPVKRYSSGMYVRLAFAVAAHLEPEILLIDEVLAVGDAAFQKKSLGKMEDVSKEGRTILFVSHNMLAIKKLCNNAICLNRSKLEKTGDTESVIDYYLNDNTSLELNFLWDKTVDAPGNDKIKLNKAEIIVENGSPNDISIGTPFLIQFAYWNLIPDTKINISFTLYNIENIMIFNSTSVFEKTWHGKEFPKGLFNSICKIPENLLNVGRYYVDLFFVKDTSRVIYSHKKILSFEIKENVKFRPGNWHGKHPGIIRPILEWETEFLDN